MVCACATGRWRTAKVETQTVETQTVETEKIENFLGMTSKHGANGFYPEPLVGDSGVIENASWASLAATAVAAINTAALIGIANDQNDIARGYYNIAQEKWDRFRNDYMPCEQKEMAEACNTPEYVSQYDTESGFYIDEVNQSFSSTSFRANDLYGRYCLRKPKIFGPDLALAKSMVAVDSGNFAFRYEEHRKLAKDDVRWTRRQQALNRGRDLQTTAAEYARAASDAYTDLSQSISSATQGATQAIGFFSARRDTEFPQRAGPSVQSGFIGDFVRPQSFLQSNDASLGRYANADTAFDTNSVATSMVGAQQPSSSGV